MFKLHQKFKPIGSSPIFEDVEAIDEDGFVTSVYKVNQPTLPKPQLFDTKKMIEAGVDLQQVNTKILSSDYSPLLDELNTPDEPSNKPKNEPSNDGE